jgi:hypothetical protein
MSYVYAEIKPSLFTQRGMLLILEIYDNCRRLGTAAGAFTAEKALRSVSGDSWEMLAALDFLCEQNYISEIPQQGTPAGQYRVFSFNGGA